MKRAVLSTVLALALSSSFPAAARAQVLVEQRDRWSTAITT